MPFCRVANKFLWQTGKQVGVRRGDEFRDGRDKLQERQSGVDVRRALARLLHQRGHIVARHIEQALKALRFLVRVHVHALRVLDQLPLECLGIVDVHDAGGNGKEFRKLRRRSFVRILWSSERHLQR